MIVLCPTIINFETCRPKDDETTHASGMVEFNPNIKKMQFYNSILAAINLKHKPMSLGLSRMYQPNQVVSETAKRRVHDWDLFF